jgi:hypothetical protein
MKKHLLKNAVCSVAVLAAVSVSANPAAQSTPLRSPSLSNLRINGMLKYDSYQSEDVKGIYEYSATSPVTRRNLVLIPRQYINGDAVVSDGKLYSYNLSVDYGYVNSSFYTVVDLATGTATKSSTISYDLGVAYSHYATSAAVNPVDGKVYCSGYTYNSDDKTLTPTFKQWNLAENTKSDIGTMQASLMVMAFDKEGNLYGITACSSKGSSDGGYLVKVDTATGSLTNIGDTGIRPWFDQSGVISPYDGRLYWFVNSAVEGSTDANAADAALYAVDLTTAKAERIGDLPYSDEVVAAWIPTQTISDNAPGVATGVTTAFSGASLCGNVNFTLPAESYSGAALTGSLTWTVTSDGKELATGTGEAGSAVSAAVEVAASGEYTFYVSVANADGTGETVPVTTYVGYGTPNAASNVQFAIEDGKNVVTWNHATGVVGKGYMAGEHPVYKIVRQPGDVLLQEAWTDSVFSEAALDGALQSTYYEVTSVNGDLCGATAKSNALVTGSSLALPYSEDFTDASSFDLYTAIDSNNDSNTWYYSVKSAKIRQVTSGSHDDWLVLPPVKLEAGYSYELKFNTYATLASYTNIIDVAMGTAIDALTDTLVSDLSITGTSSKAMKEVAATIKPQTTAVYRIGIHIKSASRQGTFTVDDITISAGQSTAIPAAPAVTAVAGDKGALSATLTITAPTLTAGGDALTSAVTSFEVERNGAALTTIAAVDGQSEYTYTDENIPAAGTYTYTVRALSALGSGEDATASVYVGRDALTAPTGVVAKDNFDGTVALSWDAAATTGVNGGYVATDKLVYNVTLPDGSTVDNITGTSTVVNIATTGTQSEVSYTVGVRYDDEAATAAVKATSNTLIAGAPYAAPFAESFTGAATQTSVWSKEMISGKSTNVSISARSDADYDEDGGGLDFVSYAADVVVRYSTPLLDLTGVETPEAKMWVKMPSLKAEFALQAQSRYGEWTTIVTLEPTDEWTEVKADLSAYADNYVRLGLLVTSQSSFNYVYVDKISVASSKTSGIDAVAGDANGNCEIYTIQGVRVADMSTSGIYIVRTAQGTRKVLVP